jgi:hypothetical protein
MESMKLDSMSPECQHTVLEFFFVFARFEYALKRSRFLRVGDNDAAKPDWQRFEREIGAAYTALGDEQFKRARKHLLDNPPRQQIVVGEALDWRDLPRGGVTDVSFLLRCVRTIRNNLFHGGKFPALVVKPLERDLPLLASSIVVLRHVAALDADVHAAFEGGV